MSRPASCRAVAFHVPVAAVLALAAWGGPARAQQIVAPPAIYPTDTWQGRSVATVRVLDTLDSSVQVLTIPVGQDATFRALTIHVGACRDRPATLTPDAAGWLAVRDTRQEGPGFNGWMLAGEPFLGVFQDPVYAVRLIGCAGDMVAPVPPPLAALAAGAAGPGDRAAGVQVPVPQGVGPQGAGSQGVGAPAATPSGPQPLPLIVPPGGQPAAMPPAPAAARPVPPPGGAPLSLSPPDESGPVAVPPPPPAAPAPPVATGRPMPLPPPVPFGADGTAGPSRSPPASVAVPASQAQPGQPQSLLPP
nr:DUF2155 domain-containing protein [Gluconacetobacter takamatsuzukensis]